MGVTSAKHGRIWRQLTNCIVAYALALQMILLSFAAPAIAASGPNKDVLGAALCQHDQTAPLAPADNPHGDQHCKYCVAGGHQAFTAPALPHHAIVRTAEAAAPPATDAFVPDTRTHASAQPRGPPPTA
jgi:hypothetical protein